MELDINEMPDNSPLKKYSSELASQDKMIIRIKKQEPDVDIEGKDSSTEHDEVVSYTCEFVQKVDETKSDLIDEICDEPIETIRQDENFIYPAITNSDDEDTNDATWQPPSNILTPGDRLTRKHMKCLYPKVEKPLSKKKKCKNNKKNVEVPIKRLKKGRPKTKQVLENIDVSKPATEVDVPTVGESITKKDCDSLTPKVGRPRKGMATPKQRLGRILKIHKMIK
ncbi:uncharacterized protein LOC114120993 [Aphis gossypii]|uniref:Uncharacterized protein n=1 Tax=Aphis gossypii TaxID=80765 RepID=A0A9P0NJB1_APHGO|nr:uncharacterized protein LOC114120993 [Aphis gossypii]XP_027838925.1 uncharacterized protein LOC114120993 [Aphis gossypii]XP_027838926.1 uncharacterized protein LOC114120993 [Aphis gossypii]XP_050063968.1 uncharacterized protein LOC114120993 [Aphis gossypii]CAH1731711.1 unnamed protein product [Aphis gossypii]